MYKEKIYKTYKLILLRGHTAYCKHRGRGHKHLVHHGRSSGSGSSWLIALQSPALNNATLSLAKPSS